MEQKTNVMWQYTKNGREYFCKNSLLRISWLLNAVVHEQLTTACRCRNYV